MNEVIKSCEECIKYCKESHYKRLKIIKETKQMIEETRKLTDNFLKE